MIAYLLAVAALALLLMLWWKNSLSEYFADRKRRRELEELEAQLDALERENDMLRRNNDQLARLIHRDNKLIPAMELSVRDFLHRLELSDEAARERARELLRELELASRERADILFSYENRHQYLPQSGIASIDSMIRYMEQKSYADGVSFHVMLRGSVPHMVETCVSAGELTTLLADLLENARISMRESRVKNILLCLGAEELNYSLEVYDSGIPFQPETIERMGREQVTTHAETGGSGIGMMTTFELLSQKSASLTLDETVEGELYTKKLSVCFDGLSQFRIKSTRPEVLALQSIRRDITWM